MKVKDYVNFETGAILKINGFDRKCSKVWVKKFDGDVELIDDSHFAGGDDYEYYPAPSLWDVMIVIRSITRITSLLFITGRWEFIMRRYR